MDPLSSLLDSINQAASSRSPSAQDVLAHASTIIAPSEQAAPQRATSAQSEQAAPESAMSTPADNGATDIVAIEVGGDDSPLSSASPEVIRLPRRDDLGRSYALRRNLVHKFIPSFSFKGTVTRPRSSSSSSSSRVTIPCLSSAALQDGSYQPGRAYHTTHGDRLDFAAARAAWGIEGRWGAFQLAARHGTLSELFPDLGESVYDNWDFKQADVLMAFLNQRMLAAPDETRHIWKLDGPLEDAPNDEVPSMAWLHMAHTGPLPPIWDLLDLQPNSETLHLLSLVEFTDLLNGCAPDALVRNAFVILRMVATARYLHLKSQELHEALMEAHGTLGDDAEERVRLREEGPAIEANAQRLTDQLAAMSNQHQEAQAAAAFNAERARLAEWDAGQLRGQIGLVQQDLARARNDLTAALAQAHTQVADLDDRLKASVAAEREASARSNQQATSLAELSARLQQQLDSSRANDERISQSLRQRQWTEAQIATLLFPSSPSSSSAVPGSNASSSSTIRPALMSPGVGSYSPMYAASGNRGAVDTPAANQGPLGRTFTPSKPGDGLRAFADNASVTVVNSSGDALTAVASTLLNAKAVRLEGASLTPKQVHAFCDHVELLIRARVYDAQTFTLLTDPQSIMAIGLRFMTSKVMERVPVPDWKVGWEVSLILEALRECYPLAALDNLVSTYDKWYNLYKSMRKTITVDQANIAQTRKQFSEQLISALADFGDMPADSEALLLSKFEKVFTHFHNPRKDYGSNRLFQNDLKEALEKDAAYTAKPSLQGLLTATQLVMNSWEKDAFRQRQRAELGADTKRKGESTSTIPIKRTRAEAPSIPDKATVGDHCQGCGRPRHTRDECRSRMERRRPLDRLQSLQSRGRHQCC